jgi:hypothetical protein
LEAIGVAMITLITMLLSTTLGWFGAKKFGIGPAEEQLVKTLRGLVDAQTIRIKQLEDLTIKDLERIRHLEAEVKELRETVMIQALQLETLKAKLAQVDNDKQDKIKE